MGPKSQEKEVAFIIIYNKKGCVVAHPFQFKILLVYSTIPLMTNTTGFSVLAFTVTVLLNAPGFAAL
jgi:hypothetical protein